jgi:hypothetical protein
MVAVASGARNTSPLIRQQPQPFAAVVDRLPPRPIGNVPVVDIGQTGAVWHSHLLEEQEQIQCRPAVADRQNLVEAPSLKNYVFKCIF